MALIQAILLLGIVAFIWLIKRLFFRPKLSSQFLPPSTVKQQIVSGIYRTLFFLWFILCGLAAIVGLFFVIGIGKMTAGMSPVSIPDVPQSAKNFEYVCLGLIFVPILIGVIASFAISSRRSAILWGRIAYGIFMAGLLLIIFFSNGKVSLHNTGQGLLIAGVLILWLGPVHIGLLGLTFLLPQIPSSSLPPPPLTQHSKT